MKKMYNNGPITLDVDQHIMVEHEWQHVLVYSAITCPTRDMCVLFQVLLSTRIVLFAIAVIWYP